MATNAFSDRVRELHARMTLDEKLAQIVGFWQDEAGDVVAPLQGAIHHDGGLAEASANGIGHVTRVYGTSPHAPAERAAWLWEFQRELVKRTRLGIPALIHEECLTGFAAWKAATFPTPLAWGAAFDPDGVEEMGALIGESMRSVGVHQGLAPVLDVVRDPRWGRVDECIGEDPYAVGVIGSAFIRGLQSQGVHATVKHFAGYSASRAGRNFGPVSAGPRETADVLLLPFEMAVKDAKVRSVMHSYAEVDGIPAAANAELLTTLLRDRWGFDGVVVADYFGVAFLHLLHEVASDLGDAARQALTAGVDIELPTGDAYVGPLRKALADGTVDEALVDRAVLRALAQKEELGLLDETFDDDPPTEIDLDTPAHRAVARRLAEESIILLTNDGILPLAGKGKAPSIAAIGPNADRVNSVFGCYSFANHVLVNRPGVELGIEVATIAEALDAEFASTVTVSPGCEVNSDDESGIADAVAAASAADVAVVVVGDHAGLFGRGTVGEGCDTDDLELPGVQRTLVEAVLDTGTPTVLVVVSGRPYAIGWALERCSAVVQAFFPGEEAAGAIAGVLSGRVNPSGRLPVTIPRSVGAQPYTYLRPNLGNDSDVTSLSNVPAAHFGFGLSYTDFVYSDLTVAASTPTDGYVDASVTVRNAGDRAGDTVVQLYGRLRYVSIPRPVAQLVGFTRVSLEPGAETTVRFRVPTTRVAFSNRALDRVVEPGPLEIWVGDSANRSVEASTTLEGATHVIGEDSPRWTEVSAG